jgi:hypothetical protein
LAALNGLAEDFRLRQGLGDDVEIRLHTFDETNSRIRPDRIAKSVLAGGARALVALVGVQSNQFPRAVDLARRFIASGVPVCIGGFHVSGCLAMLPELPEDIRAAQAMGVSLFAGEAEQGRLDELLRDAFDGDLKPLYNHMDNLPNLMAEPTPILPREHVRRTMRTVSSFDLGRGCPYQCSFCTIINVQGRKSRFRTPDDLEDIIRKNAAQGIHWFFITDDNFARNKDWEPLFDRLIELKEKHGLACRFTIQVDTLCHRIPSFMDKAVRAGVVRVFIGLENINPDNLIGAKKRQNNITEYRRMLQAWKVRGVITYAGYIIGFPLDRRASIERDIEVIKKELPIDILDLFVLTPLPGSEDHLRLYEKGAWMDGDMNKYDTHHRVAHHAVMSDEEWDEAYRRAWQLFYTPAHIETVMRRAAAFGISPLDTGFELLWFFITIEYERVHPLDGGFLRRKVRTDRRPPLPVENPLAFYPKYLGETVSKFFHSLLWGARVAHLAWRIGRDPERANYRDLSLTPPDEGELDNLELFTTTASARKAVERKRKADAIRAAVAADEDVRSAAG